MSAGHDPQLDLLRPVREKISPWAQGIQSSLRAIKVDGEAAVASVTAYLVIHEIQEAGKGNVPEDTVSLQLLYRDPRGATDNALHKILGHSYTGSSSEFTFSPSSYEGPVFGPGTEDDSVAAFTAPALARALEVDLALAASLGLSAQDIIQTESDEVQHLLTTPGYFVRGTIVGLLQGRGILGADNQNGYAPLEISNELGLVLEELAPNSDFDLNDNGAIDLVVARLDDPASGNARAILALDTVRIGEKGGQGIADPDFFQPQLQLYADSLAYKLSGL